jgi:hypothetical protein
LDFQVNRRAEAEIQSLSHQLMLMGKMEDVSAPDGESESKNRTSQRRERSKALMNLIEGKGHAYVVATCRAADEIKASALTLGVLD